jgi:hypothetical protein
MLSQWHLAGDGTATVVTLDGERVQLHSSLPFPPGATVIGVARQSDPQAPADLELRVKVRDCRRQANGLFTIEGRFVSLPRAVRVALQAELQGQVQL